MPDWRDVFDTGILRYGMTTAEKERLARERALPGAPRPTPTVEQPAADRYAAGYLFANYWPGLAPIIQPIIDAVKTSNFPFFGGEDPVLQSYAQTGANRARLEAANRYTTPVNVAAHPWEDYRSEEAERIRRRRPSAMTQVSAVEE